MRKLTISTIIFLAGTAICLCAILALALSGGEGWGSIFGAGPNNRGLGNYELVMEKEIESGNIRSLKIDYGMTFNDVFFYLGESDHIVIREYMNFTPKEKQLSKVEASEGELRIKGVRRNNFLFFSIGSWDAYTEIYLPQSLAGQMEEIQVKTISGAVSSDLSFAVKKDFSVSSTSGDIYFPEVKADKVQAGSTSGSVHMAVVLAEKISVSTTSGDISLGQAEGSVKISSTSGSVMLDRMQGNIVASTTSGDISLGQAEGDMDLSSTSGYISLQEGRGRFEGDTTSGDIQIEMLEGTFRMNTTSGYVSLGSGSGQGKAGTVSGDVKIFLDSLTGDITVSTTSGYVYLEFPETVSLALDFDSTSGECTTFFDDQLRFSKRGNQADGQYGGGEHKIDVSTVSGDLRITKK